MIVDDLFAK